MSMPYPWIEVYIIMGYLCYQNNALDYKCPGTCFCSSTSSKNVQSGIAVKCVSGYWYVIPHLPRNTTLLQIRNSNFSTLKNESFLNNNVETIKKLNLDKNNIGNIERNAFKALTSLTNLGLRNNALSTLKENTFSNVETVKSLDLKDNRFESIPESNICLLKDLAQLDISSNRIREFVFGPCFQNLTLLSVIYLEGNRQNNEGLPKEMFKNIPHVSILTLQDCNIGQIDGGVFKYASNMTSLDISNNKITHVDKQFFRYLIKLKVLYLSSNKLMTYSMDVVAGLSNLRRINLEMMGMKTLSAHTDIANFTRLMEVNVNKNKFSTLQNYSVLKFAGTGIERVHLDECSLSNISELAFAGLFKLKFVSLKNNYLSSHVVNKALYGMRNSSIEQIILDGNKLISLKNDTFSSIGSGNKVKVLSLKYSNIATLERGIFNIFSELATIYLTGNQISVIGNDLKLFENCKNLTYIDLSDNMLTSPPSSSGLSALQLTDINLSENIFSHLKMLSFNTCQNLHRLSLTKAKITSIDKTTFKYIPHVTDINLKENDIQTLKRNLFSPMVNLTNLTLEQNKIQYIDQDTFKNLSKVNFLSLTANKLGHNITNNLKFLKDLYTLQELHLSSCQISQLPDGIFRSLKELNILDLSSNNIKTWTPQVFQPLNKLQKLMLSSNKIVYLNELSFKYLTSLEVLLLENNLFACNCDLQWFVSWVFSGNIFISITSLKLPKVICASPVSLKNKSLYEVKSVLETECEHLTVFTYMIACCCTGVILLTLLTVLFKYKWYIRYWIFFLKSRRRKYEELHDATQYKYDAFISYNSNDFYWVVNQLLKNLENRNGIHLSLCLHHRDWLVGPTIADNIIESIEQSRRTVLVLSNNFARSHWCQFEMSMAQHRLMSDNKNILVIILLENISPDLMTPSLNHLLTTKTYIGWTEDEQEQIHFWDSLQNTLKKPMEFDDDIQRHQ